MELKIYGEKAKEITEGQTFTAEIGSVEGRTVVTLISKDMLEESQTPVYCGLNHSHSKDCLQ